MLEHIGPPPTGWKAKPSTTRPGPKNSEIETTFYQYDDSVDFEFKAAGKNFTSSIDVRLGVEVVKVTTPATIPGNAPKVVTTRSLKQFYPKAELRQFEDLQTLKAALGKRLPVS